jgi:hypothetical protein
MRIPFLLGLLLAVRVTAAPLTRDLGQGLVYYRAHDVPADLPTENSTRKQPSVLDLRYARAGERAAGALEAWLKARVAPNFPILVLANGDTDRALRDVIARYEPDSGVMLIGMAARDFRPHLPVQTSAERERQAYDALESGTALAILLTDNPDKIRNDEASLAQPNRLAEAATEEMSNRPARPPVDAALQRAVHLHRALLALKKI